MSTHTLHARTARRILVAGTAALALCAHAQSRLPVAPVRDVPETFFGTTVDDPYRDLENVKSPPVAAWMKAHSDRAAAVLSNLPGRSGLRAAIERYDAGTPARVIGVVRLPGDVYVYQRRGANEDQLKLFMRRGLAGAEKLLFDPDDAGGVFAVANRHSTRQRRLRSRMVPRGRHPGGARDDRTARPVRRGRAAGRRARCGPLRKPRPTASRTFPSSAAARPKRGFAFRALLAMITTSGVARACQDLV